MSHLDWNTNISLAGFWGLEDWWNSPATICSDRGYLRLRPTFIHKLNGSLCWPLGVEVKESNNSFIFRAGVGCEFELTRHWSLAPEPSVGFEGSEEVKPVYDFRITIKNKLGVDHHVYTPFGSNM